MIAGSITALVTPFREGRVDEAMLQRLVEFQIENQTDALVPCGTTGESATLSMEEHHRVVELTIAAARGRVPVVAGTGSNNTVEAIELTRAAKASGAQASLLIAPYYNKPTQEGLYRHFLSIAEATDFPFILYNIPGRTGVNVLPETIARIAQACPLLVGVKEACGNLEQISLLHTLLGDRVAILSGDDALTLPILAIGGQGVISVLGNVAPRQTRELVAAYRRGDHAGALSLHEKFLPLIKALFAETSPSPVKAALQMLGMGTEEVRLPMVSVSAPVRDALRLELKRAGLLK